MCGHSADAPLRTWWCPSRLRHLRERYTIHSPPTRLPVEDVVSDGPAALPLGVAAQLLDLGGHAPRADGLDVDQELHEHAGLGVPRQMA